MITLRPDQTEAIARLRVAVEQGPTVLVGPTGYGKSVLIAELCRLSTALGRRVLVVVHRAELVTMLAGRLAAFGVRAASLVPGTTPLPSSVLVATVQGLLAREYTPPADLVLWDECFVAGTRIDGLPIEKVKAGDSVDSVDPETGRVSRGRVTSVMRRRPSALITLFDGGGGSLTCTPWHPVLTVNGWKRAEDCANEFVQVRALDRCPVLDVPWLLPCSDGRKEPRRCSTEENGRAESNAGPARQIVGIDNASSDGAPTHGLGGQRKADSGTCLPSTRAAALAGLGASRSDGMATPDERRYHELQSGPGRTAASSGDRNRWPIARISRCQGEGREEGRGPWFARVDRVEIHGPTGDGTFGGVCPDGYVYNLEVEPKHTYFANGIAVHNCHHTPAVEWRRVWQSYPEATLVGLTATPQLPDGSGLGAVFSQLVVAATKAQLRAAGVLVPCEVYAPDRALEGDTLAWDPVATYRSVAPGEQALFFEGTVDNAIQRAIALRDAGVSAVAVWGSMPADARARAFADFAAGRVRAITNVALLTEGVDVPAASVAVLCRRVGHLGLYDQIVGRVLRAAPGKTRAVLLDAVGATHLHGPPDEERKYSLLGRGLSRAVETVAVRFCPVCGGIVDDLVCAQCGYEGEMRRRMPRVLGLPVTRFAAKRREDAATKRATYERWVADARARGYHPGHARHRYRAVYGEDP